MSHTWTPYRGPSGSRVSSSIRFVTTTAGIRRKLTTDSRHSATVCRFKSFPSRQAGRHPQLHFRGLLRLHSRYGPLDRSAAQGDLCHEASKRPVTQPPRSPATRSTDNSLGGTVRHRCSAPSGRTVCLWLIRGLGDGLPDRPVLDGYRVFAYRRRRAPAL